MKRKTFAMALLTIIICATACYKDTHVESNNTDLIVIENIAHVASEPDLVVFDKNITFSFIYEDDTNPIPYALFTPSPANVNRKMPLIVWFHGYGEIEAGERAIADSGLLKALNEWSLDGFNAYILCPHLRDIQIWDWSTPECAEKIQQLLDEFIHEKNIDTEKIIIAGHSWGGKGAVYMAHKLPNYFYKMAVLSGYSPEVDTSNISIPAVGYVEMSGISTNYMKGEFSEQFGAHNVFFIQSSHSSIPAVAFNKDENRNNRSDLIEWMLDELEIPLERMAHYE